MKIKGKSKMKVMILSLAVCLLCVVGKIEGTDFNQQDEKPNILFIAIDDLNDWTGILKGNPQARTPHIDKLASRGVVFTNAHCTAPACGPSRAAIMTGIRPSTSGNYVNQSSLTRNPILNNSVLLPLMVSRSFFISRNCTSPASLKRNRSGKPLSSPWPFFVVT